MPLTLDHDSIGEAAAAFDAEIIALRREIHLHPELAGSESRTARLVAESLRGAGLRVWTGVGGHGVVGVLDGNGAGPTVAYRADMDAVDADEPGGGEFASQVPGAAHLCGHDVHTAVGVGVALTLARLRSRWDGRAVFFFQPAEETLEGAAAMLDDGVLELTRPREVYALHCGPLPVGTFAVMPGGGLPGQDHVVVELTGPDAVAKGKRVAERIEALSTVNYPSSSEEFAALMGTLTIPDGPLAAFVHVRTEVVAEDGTAWVHAGLRVWPDGRSAAVRAQVAAAVGEVAGAEAVFPVDPFPAMVCSPELSGAAAGHLRAAFGPEAVTVLHAPFPFNGEDFALFLRRVPGAMFFLGVADEASGRHGIPRTADFAADERALPLGVRAMSGLLAARLAALGAA